MITQVLAIIISVLHNEFDMDCKESFKYNEYNICIIHYYIATLLVLFVCPYIILKIFYNILNDNNYTALFYLTLFITIAILI